MTIMSDSRERFITTTARLLQHRGYHGTSLGDILMESGAPKGSLYFHFPRGKDQLVVEATRHTVGKITANLLETLESASSPAVADRANNKATTETQDASDKTIGCPIAPLVLDGIADLDEVALVC